ncbi:MAG: DUF3307 domain-containing protein, partial [Solirubrobacteraceae bacterium]
GSRGMTWSAVFAAFVACHVAGDFLLQTEWQAITKVRGLSDPEGRRALFSHVTIYTLAFLPALIWVAADRSVARAIAVALLIAIPHVAVDDGRALRGWMTSVKHSPNAAPSLRLMVDQSFHLVFLLGAAFVAVG